MVSDFTQGAETKLLLVIRPVEIIRLHQLERDLLARCFQIRKGNEKIVYVRIEKSVHVPGSIAVLFRNEQVRYFFAAFLLLVLEPFREPAVKAIQILAVKIGGSNSECTEPLPLIAKGQLQTNLAGPGQGLRQLVRMQESVIFRPGANCTTADSGLKMHDFVKVVPVSV